jgi:hypothetical protein
MKVSKTLLVLLLALGLVGSVSTMMTGCEFEGEIDDADDIADDVVDIDVSAAPSIEYGIPAPDIRAG